MLLPILMASVAEVLSNSSSESSEYTISKSGLEFLRDATDTDTLDVLFEASKPIQPLHKATPFFNSGQTHESVFDTPTSSYEDALHYLEVEMQILESAFFDYMENDKGDFESLKKQIETVEQSAAVSRPRASKDSPVKGLSSVTTQDSIPDSAFSVFDGAFAALSTKMQRIESNLSIFKRSESTNYVILDSKARRLRQLIAPTTYRNVPEVNKGSFAKGSALDSKISAFKSQYDNYVERIKSAKNDLASFKESQLASFRAIAGQLEEVKQSSKFNSNGRKSVRNKGAEQNDPETHDDDVEVNSPTEFENTAAPADETKTDENFDRRLVLSDPEQDAKIVAIADESQKLRNEFNAFKGSYLELASRLEAALIKIAEQEKINTYLTTKLEKAEASIVSEVNELYQKITDVEKLINSDAQSFEVVQTTPRTVESDSSLERAIMAEITDVRTKVDQLAQSQNALDDNMGQLIISFNNHADDIDRVTMAHNQLVDNVDVIETSVDMALKGNAANTELLKKISKQFKDKLEREPIYITETASTVPATFTHNGVAIPLSRFQTQGSLALPYTIADLRQQRSQSYVPFNTPRYWGGL